MTLSESELYSYRRFRMTVAGLLILLFIVIVVGLLSHRKVPDSKAAWKSSPYGEPQDTGSAKAAEDSVAHFRALESRH